MSWIFGLFFDDHHAGGLEKTKDVAGRFPHTRGDGSTAERKPTQSDAKFISPHAWGLLSVSSWNIRSTETLGGVFTLTPMGLELSEMYHLNPNGVEKIWADHQIGPVNYNKRKNKGWGLRIPPLPFFVMTRKGLSQRWRVGEWSGYVRRNSFLWGGDTV